MLKMVLASFAVCSLTTFVHAETIRIDFHGTVDAIQGAEGVAVSDYVGSAISEGTSFTGYYLFDSSAQDLGMGFVPNHAVYQFSESPYGMVVEMGGFTFQTNPDDRMLIATASNDAPAVGVVPGGDSYSIASARDAVVVGTGGLKDFRPEMVLSLLGGNDVRDDTQLLLTTEQHAAYSTSTFSVQGFDPSNEDNSFLIHSGDVVFSAVPEPSSIWLTFCLVPAFHMWRRR